MQKAQQLQSWLDDTAAELLEEVEIAGALRLLKQDHRAGHRAQMYAAVKNLFIPKRHLDSQPDVLELAA